MLSDGILIASFTTNFRVKSCWHLVKLWTRVQGHLLKVALNMISFFLVKCFLISYHCYWLTMISCQARKLNKEDAMDRCKWRKVIKDVRLSG